MALHRRIVIYGNAGSGKTTMARGLGLPLLSLDDIAWQEGVVRSPLAQSIAALDAFMSRHQDWVIEGCYGDLVDHAAGQCTELRFLNPGVEICLDNARRRPWEPSYCASPEEQQRLLGPLLEFIRQYETREDEYGLNRHRAIFEAHRGAKCEYQSLPSPSSVQKKQA